MGILAFGLYLLICAGLYFNQEAILFPARVENQIIYEKLIQSKIEPWQFTTTDNTVLQGWFNESNLEKPLYIYYGGNAEDITSTFAIVSETINHSLLSVNYRGYGKSAGHPSEKKIFSDALEIFDSIQSKNKDRPICLIGRSLGSGVACYVASLRKIKSMILITPYDSIRSVAQGKYVIIPIGLLLNHPFDSIKYSQKISVPTLFLLAQSDVIIPRENSLALFNQWPSAKTKFIVPETDHNNMLWDQYGRPNLAKYINEFIATANKQ